MTTTLPRSAITAMWAWDNSVSAADDPRGRGYGPASPDRLAAYAVAGELTEVYVAAPSAAHASAVGRWFAQACATLRAAGIESAALGSEPAWLGDLTLPGQWFTEVSAIAQFDRIHLEIEPWRAAAWRQDRAAGMTALLSVVEATRAAAGSVPIDVDVPSWLAHEPFDDSGLGDAAGTTMLDAVLARADRVCILAFADHARGPDGILALAMPAVRACTTAGVEFTIGVGTTTPEIAGGASYTFFDEGPVALLQEAGVVRTALANHAGYRGISVAHHRAWRRLLGV